MGNSAKSAQRELVYFMPLLNVFGFDNKATLEDVTSQIFPSTCFFHLYQMTAN
jgi:hypothetical protein